MASSITNARFTGDHNGKPYVAEFRADSGMWLLTIEHNGETKNCGHSRNCKPCMTHVKVMLDKMFPRPTTVAKRKPTPHEANVTESFFVSAYTGRQIRVVS